MDKPLNIRSVGGPRLTVIEHVNSGGRCVFLTSGASLSGFSLTGGQAGNGGGAYGGTLTNCIITGNRATGSGRLIHGFPDYIGYGGGAYGCTLDNCTLTNNAVRLAGGGPPLSSCGGGAAYCTLNNCTVAGNSASSIPLIFQTFAAYAYGGGAYHCTLNNCTLTGNSVSITNYNGAANSASAYGGGAYDCTLNNCTLTGNSASAWSYDWNTDASCGGAAYCTLNNCIRFEDFVEGEYPSGYDYSCEDCVSPSRLDGNNWFGNPLFVDTNGWANLRLQSNSPCINAGNNAYAPAGPDLDGNPRIAGRTVDIGAYEFQSPVSQISYAWLQQYGLPINRSTDTADPDGDGVDNYHEWLAGTNPTNSLSSPAQLTITASGTNVILTWPTNAVGFTLQSTTNLFSPAAWVSNSPAPVVIADQNTVTSPITGAQRFYRLIH